MSAIETPSAASYHSLFTDALENYKRKTGQDPTTHAFATQLSTCASPEEVTSLLQKEAEQLDATHKSRWRTRVFERIAPVIEIIRPLCDTAGKATGLVFQPGDTIFGSIGILLTIPDNYMKNHDALMQLLEQMAYFLGRLKTLIIPEDVPLDDAMTKIVVDILVELIRIFALLTQRMSPSDAFIPKAKRRFRKVLATVSGDKEIDSMLKRLDELTKVEHLMTTAQARRDIAIVKREQQRQERIQQAERYRSWLSVPNSSTNQAIASEARYSDTSMWLVRGSVYEGWKSSGTLLWITGKPGAGKTVICSTIIKDLQNSLRSSGSSAALAYFYCDFRDATKQSYRGLLGSLLMDLSTQSDETDTILQNLFSKHGNGSREPDVDDLVQCLKEMLERLDGTKYIVVDALDEMPNYGISSSRAKSLELVSQLIGLGLSNLRICITSRPEDDIGQVLQPSTFHQVVLDREKEHRDDIARLIRSVVESNRKMRVWGEAIKEEVIEALSEKADGMFRYVSCQLDTLCECPLPKIRSTLKSLPTTLYATYESTLERVSEEKWEHAHRIFQCLSFSERPLRVEELAEVFAVHPDDEIPTYHSDWRSDDPESVVLSTCPGSFIQIISEDSSTGTRRIVQFTHFSVKEFLTSDRLTHPEAKASRFHVLPGQSHVVLARTCLGVLLRPNDAATVEQSTSIKPHLEEYATHLWDNHARYEDVYMSLSRVAKLLFDPTKPHFAAWARSRESSLGERNQPGTPLYFAALCGLPRLVKHIVASGSYDINARGGKHGTALFAALEGRFLTTIRLLLDHGADVNALGGRYGTALKEAATISRPDIVQLLLDRGADVNNPGGEYGSALQVAAASGNLDTVRLLLDRGANVNPGSGRYGSPLQMALSNGKPDLNIVQLLLDRGANINAQSGRLGTAALTAAVSGGKLDIVQFLLDRGADVNSQGGMVGTALQVAASSGRLDLVQLLLDHGADANAQGGRHGSVLKAAASSGMVDIVQLLLDHGADVNAQGSEYGGALQAAASSGKLDIVQLLLDRGANVNAQSGLGGTALQAAALSGKPDIIQLLLDHGADVNSQGGRYGSALQAAASSGRLNMVQLLLDRGADVNQGGLAGTALHAAVSSSKLDIVRLLLDRGADADIQSGHYGTVLQVAACNRNSEEATMIDIVKFFLDRGFDVNAQGGEFRTALIGASYHGYLDIVRLLIASGADTSIESEKYGTALEAVQDTPPWITIDEQNRTAIVKLLSSVPQDASVVPSSGGAEPVIWWFPLRQYTDEEIETLASVCMEGRCTS
ncbi:ankyrin repeat-containing domain protein [Gloeopeniophorella convolvens]|nr:ankyrin repeat-containing domain protein [Gloeopeniophorella convolvens]